jgi:flagellar basal body rod protein FlgF
MKEYHYRKLLKKFILFSIIFIYSTISGENSNFQLLTRYKKLYQDLLNYNTYGYKSALRKSENSKEYYEIQGGFYPVNQRTEASWIFPICLGISGDGYLCFIDKKGNKVYTRKGLLFLSNTGEIVSEEGYKLYPNLKINYDNQKEIKVSTFKFSLDYHTINLILTQYNGTKTEYNYKLKLYMPNSNSKIKMENEYFHFDKSIEVTDFKIYSNTLEFSTTELTKTTSEMLMLLDSLKNNVNKTDVVKIDRKIYFLEKIQEYFIVQESDNILKFDRYKYYISVLEDYKEYLSIDDIKLK